MQYLVCEPQSCFREKVHDIVLQSELLYVAEAFISTCACMWICKTETNNTCCRFCYCTVARVFFKDAKLINPQRIECLALQHVLYDEFFSSYDDPHCSFWCINSTSSVVHHGKSRKLRKWDAGVSQCEGVWWSLRILNCICFVSVVSRWCAMRK